MSQTTTEPATYPELFFCCGEDCPGLTWRASDCAHPRSCLGGERPGAPPIPVGIPGVETRSTDDSGNPS